MRNEILSEICDLTFGLIWSDNSAIFYREPQGADFGEFTEYSVGAAPD